MKEVAELQAGLAETCFEAQLAAIPDLGSPQTGPNGRNQTRPGCSVCHNLGSDSAQANLRLKQQLLRSKDEK
jgi:hypothetical protein